MMAAVQSRVGGYRTPCQRSRQTIYYCHALYSDNATPLLQHRTQNIHVAAGVDAAESGLKTSTPYE
jgi:hypothetical protein